VVAQHAYLKKRFLFMLSTRGKLEGFLRQSSKRGGGNFCIKVRKEGGPFGSRVLEVAEEKERRHQFLKDGEPCEKSPNRFEDSRIRAKKRGPSARLKERVKKSLSTHL